LSERYPLLNQPLTAVEAPPQFDNLYLDMNGIIHNCTHGNDPNLKISEEEMILRIYAYLDKLIQIIKPQNLVFMAIDGTLPQLDLQPVHGRHLG
jgi:5'-3' exoribonuclease 1